MVKFSVLHRLLLGTFFSLKIIFFTIKHFGTWAVLFIFYACLAWYKIGWIFNSDNEIAEKINKREKQDGIRKEQQT